MTPATTDTVTLEAELVALYERWMAMPEEMDLAIVALNWGGWSQAAIAERVGVIEQEVSRRVNRCGECAPAVECDDCGGNGYTETLSADGLVREECLFCSGAGAVGDPEWVTDDPTQVEMLYAEFRALPDEIDATMTKLVDAGYSYGDVGRLIDVSKQAVGPRIKRHRDRVTDG